MVITLATINLNNAEGLRQTVESFRPLRQHPDVKFVFQDGGSTDGSLEIAASFYKPDEMVSEPDGGIYDAMNRTVHRAETDYIIWINSGDRAVIENWKAIIDEVSTSGVDLYIFGIHLCDSKGSYINSMLPTPNDLAKGVAHPGTFFSKSSILAAGCYNEKYKIAGDLDLVLRIARSGAKIKTSNRIVSIFQMGGVSSSDNYWLETWRAHYENNTLDGVAYFLNRLKFYLNKCKVIRSFRLKVLSVSGPERIISLYSIGAVKVD
jgi:glycosyltransferase involved in cell wall biosynthesis